MSLPEIREADASPDIAAIYAGLRQGVGVGQVNLIWRHAAALPGMLEWLWAQARPALESGAAAGARDRIAASVALPAMAQGTAPEEVVALIETYNRGNLTNLAVLDGAAAARGGHGGGRAGQPRRSARPCRRRRPCRAWPTCPRRWPRRPARWRPGMGCRTRR